MNNRVTNLERIRAERDMQPYEPEDFTAARIEAEFARQEIEKEFPLLNAHSLVTIWSAMEALFEDVLVAHIIHRPEILKEEVFQKIRIPLATYEQLNQEDKARLLVYELQRTLSSEQRLGLDCFEALLKVVGLAGRVEDEIRRDIYELQQLIECHKQGHLKTDLGDSFDAKTQNAIRLFSEIKKTIEWVSIPIAHSLFWASFSGLPSPTHLST
jgi:hypothetical protein